MILLKTLVTWWRALSVAPTLRALSPDLLHAHWATYPSTAAWVLAETLGIPFSFTSHAHDIFVEDQLLREKLHRARLAITISAFNRKTLAGRFGAHAVRSLHVVHCGVPLGDYAYRPGGRMKHSVLSVGRLEDIKGFPYLVEACRLLRQRGVSVECDIVGEGTCRSGLQALIESHGLRDVVRLQGAMEQEAVRRLLYHARLFVLPSVVTTRGDRDGIPVVLMEAMAAGVPVVSTTVSGIPELIDDRVSGRLVPPRDAEAIAAAIEELLADPSLCAQLTGRARERVEQSFDADFEASTLLSRFEAALDVSRSDLDIP